MTGRQKIQLKRLDELIALRRRELLEDIFFEFSFKWNTVPDWNFSGDMASDIIINRLYNQKDKIVDQALRSRNPKFIIANCG